MSFEPHDYLRHILVEADYLVGQATGLTREAFQANETLLRAFVRSLEIIGEAARKSAEDRFPCRRQIHIEKQLHACSIAASHSSARQAA